MHSLREQSPVHCARTQLSSAAAERPRGTLASRWRREWAALGAFATAAALLAGAAQGHPPTERWAASWTGAAMAPGSALGTSHAFENQTVRQVLHLSVGGHRLRLRISNEYGAAPLRLGAATIALPDSGAGIVPGSLQPVSFDGAASVTIQTGAFVVSDPLDFEAAALSDVAVSLYVPEATGMATYHEAESSAYLSEPGDFTGSAELPVTETTTSRYWLTAVEVDDDRRGRAPGVVAFGDSLTEGFRSTVDANHSWPDYLAARANRHGKSVLAVLNQGIGCSRLLRNFCGPSALSRFDRDVLAQSGASDVIVVYGVTDLAFFTSGGNPADAVSADELIAGLRQLIVRGHARHLRVHGGTLIPNEESTFAGFYTPENEAVRQQINRWIRSSGEFDSVVDFDAAVRDPAHPARLLHAYASDDFTHPNDAGYAAMAACIPLDLFR